MFVAELFENKNIQVKVIYPGRFQIFHKGHASVYKHLCDKYGTDNVYIVTSDKVDPPKSPFNFAEKQRMIALTGIDTSRVVLDPQPYRSEKLVAQWDPTSTILIFAVSEKDMAEDPRFKSWTKKDGSPSYFQPAAGNAETLDKHAYILTVPTLEFEVLGKPANSASQIRALFAQSNLATQRQIMQDLFGKFDNNVFNIMKSRLEGQVAESQINELSPATHASHAQKRSPAIMQNLMKGNKEKAVKYGNAVSKSMKKAATAKSTDDSNIFELTNMQKYRMKFLGRDNLHYEKIVKARNPEDASFELSKYLTKNNIRPTKIESPSLMTESDNNIGDDLNNPNPKIRALAIAVDRMQKELNQITGNKVQENIEFVDLWTMQEEVLRRELLQRPSLFESDANYQNLQSFLSTQRAAQNVQVGQEYILVSIASMLPGKIISVASFNAPRKLVKLSNGFAQFMINGQVKQYPEGDTLSGDLLKTSLLFSGVDEAEQFKTVLRLKFSDWRITTKSINETKRITTNDLVTETGFGQVSSVQIKKEVDEMTSEMMQHARDGNVVSVAEYIKKLQPYVDESQSQLSENIVSSVENAYRVAKRNAI